jgi:ABC-type polar amino acid transport system ATPase subunit
MVVIHEIGFASKVADQMIFIDCCRTTEHSSVLEFFAAPQTERTKEFLDKILMKF